MDQPTEQKPPKLAAKPQEGGEIRSRWEWVEPAVWTERMLAALETGVEGGKWFRLIDKVWTEKNLGRALEKVVENGGSAGIDRQSVREMQMHREKEIGDLQRELREQKYRPRAVKRVWIEKLGSKEKRPLGVPAVRDRIVQGALRHEIEPIFEREFDPQSYGLRPGRGCKAALRRVEELLKSGHGWVVDADLKSYVQRQLKFPISDSYFSPVERKSLRVRGRVSDREGRNDQSAAISQIDEKLFEDEKDRRSRARSRPRSQNGAQVRARSRWPSGAAGGAQMAHASRRVQRSLAGD